MNKHLSNHTRKTQSINLSVFKANSVQALVAWRPLTLMEAFQHLLRFLGPSQLGWTSQNLMMNMKRDMEKIGGFFWKNHYFKKRSHWYFEDKQRFHLGFSSGFHNEFGFHDGDLSRGKHPFLGRWGAANWLSSWRTTPRSNDDFWSAAFAKEVMTRLNGWSLKRNVAEWNKDDEL